MAVRRERPTFKITKDAKSSVLQARKRLNWKLEDPTPLKLASEILCPSQTWPAPGTECAYAPGVSQATWKRFLYGTDRIAKEVFEAFCKILGLDWEKVAEWEEVAHTNQSSFKEKEPLTPVYIHVLKEIQKLNKWEETQNNEILPISTTFLSSDFPTLPTLPNLVQLNTSQRPELSFHNSISIKQKGILTLIDIAKKRYSSTQGNEIENQEEAIKSLKAIRDSISIPLIPEDYHLWKVIHYELAVAYKNRIQGELGTPAENLLTAYNILEEFIVYSIQENKF